MADDSSEEEASQSTLTLALDSNKQKEFEDKVKKLKAQVCTFFVLKGGKKLGLVLIVLMPFLIDIWQISSYGICVVFPG